MDKPMVLIELHTLPALGYCCALGQGKAVLLEAHEHYQKQTGRNRYYINTTRGRLRLTVPVRLPASRVSIQHVPIEPGNRWRNQHWRSIEAAYRKAPFFEHYADGLHSILFDASIQLLWELNRRLLSFCLAHVKINIPFSETMAYNPAWPPDILDLRNVVPDPNQAIAHHFYRPQPYYQVFGNTFVPDCSIIDLLFCVGPASFQQIQLSMRPMNK